MSGDEGVELNICDGGKIWAYLLVKRDDYCWLSTYRCARRDIIAVYVTVTVVVMLVNTGVFNTHHLKFVERESIICPM